MTSLVRTLAAAWVVLMLLGGGRMLDRAWDHDAHVTPEQWSYHVLLSGLGFVEHHDNHAADNSATLPLTYDAPAFVPLTPPALIVLETLALLALLVVAFVRVPGPTQRLRPAEPVRPSTRALHPGHGPPRHR